MTAASAVSFKQILSVRWNPGRDLAVVALSWVLVVGALYTATVIVGTAPWDGMAYFFLYAVVNDARRVRHPVMLDDSCPPAPIAGLGPHQTSENWPCGTTDPDIAFATLAKLAPPADMVVFYTGLL
jgi:hypothetical protein